MLINMNKVDQRMSNLISRLNFDASTWMFNQDLDRLVDSILLVTGITITPQDNATLRANGSRDVSAAFVFNGRELEVLSIRYFLTFDRVTWAPRYTEATMGGSRVNLNVDYKLFVPRMSKHVRSTG